MQVALDFLRPARADEEGHAERDGCLVDVVLGRDVEMVSLVGAVVNV